MPCKPISNTKRILTKKPMPRNLNKPITSRYYSQKQTSKGAKFLLQTFGGLDHILLTRCYRTMIIRYAKRTPIRRKSFIESGYANSHPVNLYQTYQSNYANGNQTPKLSLNMMIYTPQHGSVKMMSQYSMAITINWQHLVYPKLQYDQNKQLMKWGTLREPYQKIPQKQFLSQTDRMTEWTRITTCSVVRMPV